MASFGRPASVRLRALTGDDAAAVAAWRYEGPWSVYDGRQDEQISAEKGYTAIVDEDDRFLGYVCTGEEARVAGLTEEPGVLDVGVGLDPLVVGHGHGASILGPLLEVVAASSRATTLRALVQSWNERSLRLCSRLGFREVGRHVAHGAEGDVEYVVVVRSVDR